MGWVRPALAPCDRGRGAPRDDAAQRPRGDAPVDEDQRTRRASVVSLVRDIVEFGGRVDKILGDAILALWHTVFG